MFMLAPIFFRRFFLLLLFFTSKRVSSSFAVTFCLSQNHIPCKNILVVNRQNSFSRILFWCWNESKKKMIPSHKCFTKTASNCTKIIKLRRESCARIESRSILRRQKIIIFEAYTTKCACKPIPMFRYKK